MTPWDRFDKLSAGIKRCILVTVIMMVYFYYYSEPPFGFVVTLTVVVASVAAFYQLDKFITKLWRGE